MSTKRDMRVDGEYDRPLPERTETLTKEEQEELLQEILAKHRAKIKDRITHIDDKAGNGLYCIAPDDEDLEAFAEHAKIRTEKNPVI